VEPDILPKVTPSLLRHADRMCARRLAGEFEGARGSFSPVNRSRLRDSFLEAARNAHARLQAPPIEAFAPPASLEPEEQTVFRQAARWYVEIYGNRPVRTYLHGLEAPTLSRARGLRIGGWVDLTVIDGAGRKELRQLELWGGAARGADPLDHEAIRLAVLRLSRWAGDEPLRVSWADLVRGELVERVVDVAAELPILRAWFDERLAIVRDRITAPDAMPGRDCGTCIHVSGCPAHPQGANAASRRGDLRPGIVTLSPTTIGRWRNCRREWLTRTLLSVPPSDESGFPDHGRLVHDLLRFVHEHGSCHDGAHVAEALADHGLGDDELVRAELDRHQRRCPSPAEALGHERELARFHRTPLPLFMGTARLDALWVHDGVLDVRDYKTGGKHVARVADDLGAGLQAWVVAPLAGERGLRLQLRYEQLSPDVDDDPDTFEPDDDDLEAIEEQLRQFALDIKSEEVFAGVADRDVCKRCGYRSICRDSAAPGMPTWPVPPETGPT
jgi:PD-(D/E)XK nuclease superfamily protein